MLTLKQLSSIEEIFHGDTRRTQKALEQICRDLQSKHIIGTNEKQQLVFLGDEFERIYAKYFARERKINLHIVDLPSAMAWSLDEFDFFQRKGIPVTPFEPMGRTPEKEEVLDIVTKLGRTGVGDVFREHSWLASELYWILIQHEKAQFVEFLQLRVEFEWLSDDSLFCFKQPPESDVTNETKKLCEQIESAVTSQGGKLTWSLYRVEIPPRDALVEAVLHTEERYARYSAAHKHFETAIDQYLKKRDKQEAVWHASSARSFSAEHLFDCSELNNIGYIFLSNGDTQSACDLFEESIDLCAESVGLDYILPRYNLGVAQLVLGDMSLATDLLREVVDGAVHITESRRSLACLMLPQVAESGISLAEEFNPDILDVAQRTLATVECLLETGHSG